MHKPAPAEAARIKLPSPAVECPHICADCPHNAAYTKRRNDFAKSQGTTTCQAEKSDYAMHYDRQQLLLDVAAEFIKCADIEKQFTYDAIPEFGTPEWTENNQQCLAHDLYIELRDKGF